MLRRIFWWLRRDREERDLADEIESHLAIEARLSGDNPRDAALAARRAFGSTALAADETRDVWRIVWLGDLWRDLRYAARTLRRGLSFAAVAALTLALGIGATTAVYSIVDAVLLRPLPYKDPERLVAIWGHGIRDAKLSKVFLDYGDFEAFRKSGLFENIAAATWAGPFASRTLTGVDGPARQIVAIPVDPNFFTTLGAKAALGRTFHRGDETAGCSLVVAHSFWSATLAADPNAAGRTLTLDQKPCTILGVMPASFAFYPSRTQVWTLLDPRARLGGVGIFARLKPGVTPHQAEREVVALHRAAYPDGPWHDIEPAVYGLHGEFTFLASRTLRTTLIVAFAAVVLVLLIACLNVANLLLARLGGRQRELAVRAALGSGRSRLIRQVLTETLLLSLFGTAVGLALAHAAIGYFRWSSPIELTAGAEVSINPHVLLFAIALSLITTIIFGLLPAIGAARVDIVERLKAAGRGAVSRHGAAKLSIAVQMALSFVLLIAAGLLMNSALRMGSEPLGFDPTGLLATDITLSPPGYAPDSQKLAFYNRLEETIRGVRGVTDLALTSKTPPVAGGNQQLEVQGQTVDLRSRPNDVGADSVSPGFFGLLNISFIRGRLFDGRDRSDSEKVAIVNRALVAEYFPSVDPIGQRIRIADLANNRTPWATVVGVVGNLKHSELMNEMNWVETPILYLPLTQSPRRTVGLVVRTAANASSIGRDIERAVSSLDPAIPLGPFEPLTLRVSHLMAYPNFRATVLGVFALSALLLSAVGLHGLLSQLVARRTSEFGVRRAVGAQTKDLLLLVARQGGTPVAAGLVCGWIGTVAFSRLLSGLLYGVQPAEPAVLFSVSVLLLIVAALAIALPAARAVRVQPVAALRDE